MSENSDFENLMTASALDKDEAECIANFGSIQNLNVSFSGISPPSQFGLNFMPSEDSLFQHFKDLESINLTKDEITNKKASFQTDNSHRPSTGTSASHQYQTQTTKPQQRTQLSGLPKISEISELISSWKEKNNNLAAILNFDEFVLQSKSSSKQAYLHDDNAFSFQIESTHKSLTWPSVHVGETMKKICFIKHNSVHSEELHFSFGVSSMNCFRFSRDGNLLSEFSAKVKPNTPFVLEIIFLPDCVSQSLGTVEINRMSKERVNGYIIHLYAYGGKSIPTLNIAYNLANHTPHLVVNDSKLTNFSVRNLGTDDLFFILNIRAKYTGEFTFEIVPESGLVSPGEEKIVTIKLKRFKNFKNNTHLNKLLLTKIAELEMKFGDESTRLRIVRIYNKFYSYVDSFLGVIPELITDILTNNSSETRVSELHDGIEELPSLYAHVTDKCNINVFFERSELTDANKLKLEFVPLRKKLIPE